MFHELFSSKMFVEEETLKTFNFHCGYQILYMIYIKNSLIDLLFQRKEDFLKLKCPILADSLCVNFHHSCPALL